MNESDFLILSRFTVLETSSLGIVTLPGHTSRLCVTNAATKATNPITTGHDGQTIR
jgi:hypothetical protein